jgi:hypothetical protein
LALFVLISDQVADGEGGLLGFADEGNAAESAIIDDPIFGDAKESIFFDLAGIVCFPVGADNFCNQFDGATQGKS